MGLYLRVSNRNRFLVDMFRRTYIYNWGAKRPIFTICRQRYLNVPLRHSKQKEWLNGKSLIAMRGISRVWNTFVFSLLLFLLSHTVSKEALVTQILAWKLLTMPHKKNTNPSRPWLDLNSAPEKLSVVRLAPCTSVLWVRHAIFMSNGRVTWRLCDHLKVILEQ